MAVTDTRSPPRVRLARLPTPLHGAPRLAAALGIRGRLLVKRDDLTGFAAAGNKARPLEVLVADAQLRGADVLVTGGASSSNFCAAAAGAARWAGLRCLLVYAGTGPEAGHPNLAAARQWGAELRWTGSADRASVDAGIEDAAERLRDLGQTPYAMPRGGADALGATGFHAAAHELVDQLGSFHGDDGPTAVVLAAGSGASASGLLAGAATLTRPITVLAASVSRPPDETRARVLSLARGCAGLMDGPAPRPEDLVLVDARGPGHALPSEAGGRAAELALGTEGLVLDPVYTAKALGALPELLGGQIHDADLTTVFWHTGGLLDAVAAWSR